MNNVSGLGARSHMIKAFEERGVKTVVDETYNLPLSDAGPLVSKAKGRGRDSSLFVPILTENPHILRFFLLDIQLPFCLYSTRPKASSYHEKHLPEVGKGS